MISVYYPYDFEAHKNLSHKQFLIQVYYFMDYAVFANIRASALDWNIRVILLVKSLQT